MTQLRRAAAPSDFDDSLRLTPVGRGSYRAEAPERWSALIGVHGGYLAAIATHAAEVFAADCCARTVSTTFLRPAVPGPLSIGVTELRRSRSLCTLVVDVGQARRTVASTRVTLVGRDVPNGIEWTPPVAIDLPDPADCEPIVDRSPSPHFRRAVGTLDPSSLPFTDGPRAMVRGYLRPNDARPIDAMWLAMASDWFPPPAFVRTGPPVGGISVDLTTHVHRTLERLEDDWLMGQFEITTSDGGMATEHGVIATLDGVLLAESFQTRWMVAK